jgi:hypothetical protein
MYVRRHEPQIVFGSIDSGVANGADEKGLTFLDQLWGEAPFSSHRQFMTVVTRVAGEWQKAGRFTAQQQAAMVEAARKAEKELT